MKISIAVGGTGVRSLSLIGILDAFSEEKIEIENIYSVGMTTIISTMLYSKIYVFSIVNLMRKIALFRTNLLLNFESKKESYKDSLSAYMQRYRFCSKNLITGKLKSNERLESKLSEFDIKYLSKIKTLLIDIESMKIGYYPVISKEYLIASLSYGGIFEPVPIEDKKFVSGIDLSEIPVITDKNESETIVAYDVTSANLRNDFNSILGIWARADEVRSQRILKLYEKNFDYKIDLPISKESYWNEVETIPQIIEEGYEKTKKFIKEELR